MPQAFGDDLLRLFLVLGEGAFNKSDGLAEDGAVSGEDALHEL